MNLSPDDYATLNAAVADLRQWDARDALKARAGGRRNVRIAQVAENLERIANADEATELPAVLAHYRYAEDLDFLDYALIASNVAGLEEAHQVRRAAIALLKQLRVTRAGAGPEPASEDAPA